MIANKTGDNYSFYTLFSVEQSNGQHRYYACDFSEQLGNSVYKGYLCTVKPNTTSKPQRVRKEDVTLNKDQPVAIKIYDEYKHPSPYQFYSSEIAVERIQGRDALVMDLIDGFHIHPDASDNPEIKRLTFFQAADIAWKLIIELNRLHYDNSSGPSIVHADIRGDNLKIKINGVDGPHGKEYKIDVMYLDLDYAKPIVNAPQKPQGTPEHVALEVLEGYYSESSDFFALSPLLLSIFGANNPLRHIIEFRHRNPDMELPKLITEIRAIDFCTDGLFEHFENKPEPLVCTMLEQFILRMGEKNLQDRPSPDAILEFFTALRQLSLLHELDEERDVYLIRLFISAQYDACLVENKYQNIFFNLNEYWQERLVNLMNSNQCIEWYKIARGKAAPETLIRHLRNKTAGYLNEKMHQIDEPPLLSSLFLDPVRPNNIQWLLNCYEHQDSSAYYAPGNQKIRRRIEHCTERNLAPLISIVAEGIDRPSVPTASSKPIDSLRTLRDS